MSAGLLKGCWKGVVDDGGCYTPVFGFLECLIGLL